jgi:actin-related protein
MYCGDETGAYIGDVGSHTARFGYGGEDNPKYVAPSYMATSSKPYVPTSCYRYHDNLKPVYRMANNDQKPVVDPTEFLSQGDTVENWDALEEVWQHSFDVLRARERFKHTKGGGAYERKNIVRGPASPDELCVHPILAVRPGCTHVVDSHTNQDKEMEKYIEFMFETLQADSCFIAPSPMLAAFSHGRQTCLVVDVGASGCKATPVVDGLVLEQAQRRNGRGADWLANVTWNAMLKDGVDVVPRYRVSDTKAKMDNPFMTQWAIRDLMFEFRTSPHVSLQSWRYGGYTTPFVYQNSEDANEDMAQQPETYELPDGTLVNLETNIGHDLKRVPELLFTDDIPFVDNISTKVNQHATLSNAPLHQLVYESLSAVGDADLRKELCNNIVLVGGSSLFPNMEQRLSYEISGIITSSVKCKVIASKFSVERSCAPWIGASVLTSLGSFQQLWLSRKEYDELGPSLAGQRFP